jgi:isopenicillin-N epimerase
VSDASREAPNPLWGGDWPEVAARWTLDPAVTFLNHGSFGATPRAVLEAQDRWRAEMEREPVEFLWRRLPGLLGEAKAVAADFLDADHDGFAFVRNATTGVAIVLASMELRAGDRIVATDHVYPGVLNCLRRTCERAGADLTLAPIPLGASDAEAVQAFAGALDERTRLAVVEHVTSSTATIFPAAPMIRACRDRGVPVLLDAAHAPGMLDVSVRTLDPDFWTGNFHKWVCAPKGSAGLWVAPQHRDRIHPLVTSHGAGQGLGPEFDFQGTDDYTAYLSVPDALAFMAGLGWERIRTYNHALVEHGQRVIGEALGTAPPVSGERFGSMALVDLPVTLAPDADAAAALQARLFEEHHVEVPAFWWNGRAFLRLSAQVYNRPGDYDRLAEALHPKAARSGYPALPRG